MKQFIFTLFFILLSTTLLAYEAEIDGNNQNLTVSDIRCSHVHYTRNVEDEEIALYKDGSDLQVVLGFYRCNPFITGFDIVPTINEGSKKAPDSVSVNVVPVVPEPYNNTNVLQQWFHVYFTIHGLEADSFYFSCLWFEGQVSLTKGKSLLLKDPGVEVTIDDVIYRIYEMKHFAALSNGKNANGELTIPSVLSYNGEEYPVKAIESQAFKGCSTLTSVTIPDSVIAIEKEAFSSCSSLSAISNGKNVEMVSYNAFSGTPWLSNQPDGVVYLGKVLCARKGDFPEGTDLTIREETMSITPGVFQSCKGLSSVIIPEGITNIDGTTFAYCNDLVSVKLPESLTIIEIDAFRCCDKITSIHLPSNMKYLCSEAFRDCRSLTSINIPEGVESIDDGAFQVCNNMATITLPESLKKIGYEAFCGCKSLSAIKIPDNVEEIDEAAFAYCIKLTSLTLSEKLKLIGISAFYECSDLSTIVCNAQVPPTKSPYMNKTGGYMSTGVFYNVDKQNCKLYVPQGCEEAYRTAEEWKDFNIIEMGTGISEMANDRAKSEKYTNETYDLSGRKMFNGLKKGIYIQNGKKILNEK